MTEQKFTVTVEMPDDHDNADDPEWWGDAVQGALREYGAIAVDIEYNTPTIAGHKISFSGGGPIDGPDGFVGESVFLQLNGDDVVGLHEGPNGEVRAYVIDARYEVPMNGPTLDNRSVPVFPVHSSRQDEPTTEEIFKNAALVLDGPTVIVVHERQGWADMDGDGETTHYELREDQDELPCYAHEYDEHPTWLIRYQAEPLSTILAGRRNGNPVQIIRSADGTITAHEHVGQSYTDPGRGETVTWLQPDDQNPAEDVLALLMKRYGPAEGPATVCPTCGKNTVGSEEWSTGQCDDCHTESITDSADERLAMYDDWLEYELDPFIQRHIPNPAVRPEGRMECLDQIVYNLMRTAGSDPTTLMIPDHLWKPNEEMFDPQNMLHATVVVCGLSMHFEAWEVNELSGQQVTTAASLSSELTLVRRAVHGSGPFQTTTINGRSYVIIATPHCQ